MCATAVLARLLEIHWSGREHEMCCCFVPLIILFHTDRQECHFSPTIVGSPYFHLNRRHWLHRVSKARPSSDMLLQYSNCQMLNSSLSQPQAHPNYRTTMYTLHCPITPIWSADCSKCPPFPAWIRNMISWSSMHVLQILEVRTSSPEFVREEIARTASATTAWKIHSWVVHQAKVANKNNRTNLYARNIRWFYFVLCE